ncbi:unnamed protein product [Orchesella dallaii]|uniref:Uncharacterized protein n=1 Tax=Orchesella dallaii TaxID=48710 RepID=A0ABP1SAE1_9HEXA
MAFRMAFRIAFRTALRMVMLDELFGRISSSISVGNKTLRDEIMPVLENIKSEHKQLCTRVTNIEAVNKKQAEKEKKYKEDADNLANDVNDLGHMQRQLKEQQDRIKRLNNIVVMGIPEDEMELQTLHNVMQVIMPGNNLRLRAKEMRIGIEMDSKTRPIRVQLNCNNDVWTALGRGKELKAYSEFDNIYIRKDNTRVEREERAKKRPGPYMTRAHTLATATKRGGTSDEGAPAPKMHRMDTTPSQ